jgi:hypothetical protein
VEGQRPTDGVDAQRRALQHIHRRAGQGCQALGVQGVGENGGDELRDPVAVEGVVALEVAAWSPPPRISRTCPYEMRGSVVTPGGMR